MQKFDQPKHRQWKHSRFAQALALPSVLMLASANAQARVPEDSRPRKPEHQGKTRKVFLDSGAQGNAARQPQPGGGRRFAAHGNALLAQVPVVEPATCLLYTSDAADE